MDHLVANHQNMEVMSCGFDNTAYKDVFFSKISRIKLLRGQIREAVGAAFSPSVL